MFGSKKEQEIPQSEADILKEKTYEFPWPLLFENTLQGGLFAKIFPFIATALLFILIIIVALKK